jgi:hypothetical protein
VSVLSSISHSVYYEVERKIVASYAPKKPTSLLSGLLEVEYGNNPGEYVCPSLHKTLRDSLVSDVTHVEVLARSFDQLLVLVDSFTNAIPNIESIQAFLLWQEALQIDAVEVGKWLGEQRRSGVQLTLSVIYDQKNEISEDHTLDQLRTIAELIGKTQESCGGTVTLELYVRPANIWKLDEILEIAIQNNARIIFRMPNSSGVGVFDPPGSGGSLSKEQTHNFALFLVKVLRVYEKNIRARSYYDHLLRIFSGDERRISGCLFQSRALVVYENGDLALCPLYSKRLKNTDGISPDRQYRDHLLERRRIAREHCPNCHYFSEAPTTTRQLLSKYMEKLWLQSLTLDHAMRLFRLTEKSS